MLNRKWRKFLIWLSALVLAYFAYDEWKSYRYEQSQRAEQAEMARKHARKALLDQGHRKLGERFKTYLEGFDAQRSGSIQIATFADRSAESAQLMNLPFLLEIGQEVEFPKLAFAKGTTRFEARLSSATGNERIIPRLMKRIANEGGGGALSWSELGDHDRISDGMQLKLSLRPSPYDWGTRVDLGVPADMKARQGLQIQLFLLAPSRARKYLQPDESGMAHFVPDESGLWRYIWYYENAENPLDSQSGEWGVFYVIPPVNVEQLENAAKPFYHRLSKRNDESKDYRVDQLIRALAQYSRRGEEESQFVDELLRLIRSKEPTPAPLAESDKLGN